MDGREAVLERKDRGSVAAQVRSGSASFCTLITGWRKVLENASDRGSRKVDLPLNAEVGEERLSEPKLSVSTTLRIRPA
jgi:hypothetical protein